jgi:hypothetical protein
MSDRGRYPLHRRWPVTRAPHAQPAQRPRGRERRRHQRYQVSIPAFCQVRAGPELPVTIVDVSSQGFGLDRPLPCQVDERVAVIVPYVGTFAARVAWVGERRCGVELLCDLETSSDDSAAALAAGLALVEEMD